MSRPQEQFPFLHGTLSRVRDGVGYEVDMGTPSGPDRFTSSGK